MSDDPLSVPIILISCLLYAILTACEAALDGMKDDTEQPDRARDAIDLWRRTFAVLIVVFALRLLPYALPADEALGLKLSTVAAIAVGFVIGFELLLTAIPRAIAAHDADKAAARLLPLIRFMTALLTPFLFVIEKLRNLLLRLVGIDPMKQAEEVTEEEIRALVETGGESGGIEKTEQEMIENIFEFNNRSAGDVMIHRTAVEAIWVDDDADEILQTIVSTGLSRFPVYDADKDDIIGVLNTRDYLLNSCAEQPRPLRDLLRDAYFVPETVQADSLFRDMQKKKVHMAIVSDEYGGMSGIVTMEDLLEEIVGNIYDEFDPLSEQEIVKLGDNLYRIAGSAALEDVAEALQLTLPLDEEYDTLGGLIFDQFTVIPQDGTTPEVDVCGMHIQVERLLEHRVESALVSLQPADPAD